MPGDDAHRGDRDTHTVELSARLYEHVQAMGMPDESESETLERLLGLSPDPATVAGDELSTPLPEDPVVPDALASDPTTEAAAVDPTEVPEPEPAPADVDAALGELAGLLPEGERDRIEERLSELDGADADTIADVVDAIDAAADETDGGPADEAPAEGDGDAADEDVAAGDDDSDGAGSGDR